MRGKDSNDSTVRKSGQFKKFRDNAKRRLHWGSQRLKWSAPVKSPAASISQLISNKILRTIKSRQKPTIPQEQQKEPAKKSRRKKNSLKEANNSLKEANAERTNDNDKPHDTSIEEGEIVSEDEAINKLENIRIVQRNHTKAPTSKISNLDNTEESEIATEDEVIYNSEIIRIIQRNHTKVSTSKISNLDNTDDDCICIEPYIEQIVIDDDKPATSSSKAKNGNSSSGYVSLIQRMNDRGPQSSAQLITSTPKCMRSPQTTDAQNSRQNKDADLGELFYEDVSSINTSEKADSNITLTTYTTVTGLISGSGGKRRRRIKGKLKGHGKHSKKRRGNNSKDVIIVDDSMADDATLKPLDIIDSDSDGEMEGGQKVDDSVIFISETVGRSNKPAPMRDFVPLESNNVPNPIFVPKSPPRQPRQAAINSGLLPLFTSSEKKELVAYNNNTYNPNAGNPEAPEKQSKKRLVLIDGSNVAFNHSLNKEFSVKGLKICIDYFEKMGHEVKAVVPQFRMHRCTDSEAMFELHKAGKIVVTPCKNLPGKFSVSYDDRFVLQLACEMDAAIVSNDNYRDLINENAAFKKLIENRVLGFTWCNDLFMVAKDPYGKWGPPLQAILNRT